MMLHSDLVVADVVMQGRAAPVPYRTREDRIGRDRSAQPIRTARIGNFGGVDPSWLIALRCVRVPRAGRGVGQVQIDTNLSAQCDCHMAL